jgi:acyl-CoA reductase-like NAD-dependent aldehyde dehydrogenase
LPRTEVGPLINPREVDRVESWVTEAAAAGAKILVGGKRRSATIMEPTVLLEPGPEARVSREEVFGPVTCVYEFDQLDDAIDRANSLPVAFQASVFAKDINVALYAADRLDASAVMINDHTAFRTDWMPFAGRRESGYGVGGIPFSMREMTQEKMRVFRYPA